MNSRIEGSPSSSALPSPLQENSPPPFSQTMQQVNQAVQTKFAHQLHENDIPAAASLSKTTPKQNEDDRTAAISSVLRNSSPEKDLDPLSKEAVELLPLAENGNEGALQQLAKVLRNPKNSQEKRLLLTLTKKILKASSRLYPPFRNPPIFVWLQTLTQEQCAQLPWEEFPRWMHLVLAFYSHTLQIHAHALRQLAGELNKEERTALSNFVEHFLHIDFLALESEETQASRKRKHVALTPLVTCLYQPGKASSLLLETLLEKIFSKIHIELLLSFPRPLLMSHTSLVAIHIYDLPRQAMLVKNLSQKEVTQLLRERFVVHSDTEWDDFVAVEFPFGRFIECGEFELFFWQIPKILDQFIEKMKAYPSFQNALKDVLAAFEKHPWKLCMLHDHQKLLAFLHVWEEETFHPRQLFPKCYAFLDWAMSPRPDQKLNIENAIEHYRKLHPLFMRKQWREIWELFHHCDENEMNFILADFRNASLELAVEQMSSHEGADKNLASSMWWPRVLFALFDPQAREKILQVLTWNDGQQDFHEFNELLGQLLSNTSSLPPEIKDLLLTFLTRVRQLSSMGGPQCPLYKQYDNPAFADIIVHLGNREVMAHRVLLASIPFFQPFMNQDCRHLRIPDEKSDEAHTLLRSIYGVDPTPDATGANPERSYLPMQMQKNSLAQLYQNPDYPSDCTFVIFEKVKEKDIEIVCRKEIGAHKFIVASACENLEYVFSPISDENKTGELEIKDHSYLAMEAAVRYIYTGTHTSFTGSEEEHHYRNALQFLGVHS